MAYSGNVKFITEDNNRALVEETAAGAANPDAHRLINADFSSKVVGDIISYNYNADSDFNNGRDVTLV
jgi:hypothetical protein